MFEISVEQGYTIEPRIESQLQSDAGPLMFDLNELDSNQLLNLAMVHREKMARAVNPSVASHQQHHLNRVSAVFSQKTKGELVGDNYYLLGSGVCTQVRRRE